MTGIGTTTEIETEAEGLTEITTGIGTTIADLTGTMTAMTGGSVTAIATAGMTTTTDMTTGAGTAGAGSAGMAGGGSTRNRR
jgi:hypothetical protein